jgi:hypothetical protein
MDEEPSAAPTKTFRIGLLRHSSNEFKPIATVGLSRDGGVMLSPRTGRDHTWNYGQIWEDRASEHKTMEQTPKLHYHRSGVVSATLSGAEFDRYSLRLPPLDQVDGTQIMSLVAARPWEFETETGRRKGDVPILVRKWPQSVGVSFAVVRLERSRVPGVLHPRTGFGLVPGDDSRFFIDLSHRVPGAMLMGHVRLNYEGAWEQSGSTVSALSFVGEASRPARAYGLWSSAWKHPEVFRDSDIPTQEMATRLLASGELIGANVDEHFERLKGVL